MAGRTITLLEGDYIMGQIIVEKNVGGIDGLCVITPAVHGDNRGSVPAVIGAYTQFAQYFFDVLHAFPSLYQ